MRLIIAGSRGFPWEKYSLLASEASKIVRHPAVVLCGEAPGADAIGKKWAERSGIPVESYPADWKTHPKEMCDGTCAGSRKPRPYCSAAGKFRNEKMARNADTLLAFWDGKSPGTLDMINRAKDHGLDVHVIKYNP